MHTTIDGADLHYDLSGNGEPVLFVHGYPLSGELWAGTVERLRGHWRAIVPDLRGMGRSESAGEASLERYADDLLALLDHLGETRPVVLVGLSMGGYVAFEVVRRAPERVRALVLVDTRAGPDSEEGARGRLESAERALREGSAAVSDPMVAKLFAAGSGDELRERWRGIMAATPPEGIAAALRAMAARPDSLDTLRDFPGPVLVVVGEEDAITPPAEAERMHEAAGVGRLVVIPGAGHMTPVEQPDAFADALRAFLEDLRSGP